MDNLPVADIHGHMVHLAAAACVEYQLAGPHVARGHRLAHLGL